MLCRLCSLISDRILEQPYAIPFGTEFSIRSILTLCRTRTPPVNVGVEFVVHTIALADFMGLRMDLMDMLTASVTRTLRRVNMSCTQALKAGDVVVLEAPPPPPMPRTPPWPELAVMPWPARNFPLAEEDAQSADDGVRLVVQRRGEERTLHAELVAGRMYLKMCDYTMNGDTCVDVMTTALQEEGVRILLSGLLSAAVALSGGRILFITAAPAAGVNGTTFLYDFSGAALPNDPTLFANPGEDFFIVAASDGLLTVLVSKSQEVDHSPPKEAVLLRDGVPLWRLGAEVSRAATDELQLLATKLHRKPRQDGIWSALIDEWADNCTFGAIIFGIGIVVLYCSKGHDAGAYTRIAVVSADGVVVSRTLMQTAGLWNGSEKPDVLFRCGDRLGICYCMRGLGSVPVPTVQTDVLRVPTVFHSGDFGDLGLPEVVMTDGPYSLEMNVVYSATDSTLLLVEVCYNNSATEAEGMWSVFEMRLNPDGVTLGAHLPWADQQHRWQRLQLHSRALLQLVLRSACSTCTVLQRRTTLSLHLHQRRLQPQTR